MKFLITRNVNWGLRIPFGTDSFKIDKFTLTPDFPNMPQVKHISIEVEAPTKEEAEIIADNQIKSFFNKWNFLDNSKPHLMGGGYVKNLITNATTCTHTISAGGYIVKDITDNLVDKFKATFPPEKQIDEEPFNGYRQAFVSEDLFDQYKKFYKVIEFYYLGTRKITKWIRSKESKVMMVPGEHKPITIYSSIRHRLSHPSKPGGQKPLSADNPKDVQLIKNNLPKIQELARMVLEENLH